MPGHEQDHELGNPWSSKKAGSRRDSPHVAHKRHPQQFSHHPEERLAMSTEVPADALVWRLAGIAPTPPAPPAPPPQDALQRAALRRAAAGLDTEDELMVMAYPPSPAQGMGPPR